MPDAGRVISGSARGIRLAIPPLGTRPLTDRVKEATFAALEAAGALHGSFLDLFAGSGAAGIEALSRGAQRAVFVEHDGKTCAAIGTNLRHARLEDGHVVRADVLSYLHGGTAAERVPFEACFVDPPYGDPIIGRVLELLGDADRRWLADGAHVVAKNFWRDELPEHSGTLQRIRQRRFGETMLTFYTCALGER